MVLEDVIKACDIVSGKNMDNNYDLLYFSSNEPLELLFQSFSCQDKDILTVLGSSDQYFYSLYYGNQDVDVYDKNILAKYYYYLRRWSILYKGNYYLPDKIIKSHMPIYELLRYVSPDSQDEEDAYLFWRDYIQNVFPFDNAELFYTNAHRNDLLDMKLLREKLEYSKPTFYHIDLFKDVDIPKKYDLVITSNIFEYGRNNILKITTCRDNMIKILKDKGEVISSHLIHYSEDPFYVREKELFDKYFDYKEFPYYHEPIFKKKFPLGYQYIKK